MKSKEACPAFEALDLIGKKWTLPLLQQIEMHDSEGFNKLMARIEKISPKILAERLKALERQKIIVKKTEAKQQPAKTTYTLTQKGKELQQILSLFRAWMEKHEPMIQGCAQKECVVCEYY